MKRNILYVSLAAALATTTLSGCIDNDEPDGILALRQAKASYINAQAANETTLANADAAYKAAETAVKNAEAKQAEAIAKKAEYEAALAEYEVKLAEAKTDAEIAAIKAELEVTLQEKANELQQAKAAAEQLAQEAETQLNLLKASYNESLATLEQSASAYAEALKQIKANETVLDTKTGSYITVARVYQKYLTSKDAFRSATEVVAAASAEYIEALVQQEVETNELANELADDLKDAKLQQQAAEKALEVQKTALETAQNKGLMTETEYTEKVNEIEAQISAIDVKIAENQVAQAKFAVEPKQQKVELQNQIDELNDQIDYDYNAAGDLIYPNNETLNAIQAKINAAEDEIEALKKDYNEAMQAVSDERSYWQKKILTWSEVSVSNYSDIKTVLYYPLSFTGKSIFEMNDDENKIVVKAGYEDYYTNGSVLGGSYYSYFSQDIYDSELATTINYDPYASYENTGSFTALRLTLNSICEAYANAGATTATSKLYKSFSSIKSTLDVIYNDAKKVYDGFADEETKLTSEYNTTTANQVLEIENKTIPALQKELADAKEVITDQIEDLTDQKNAIATTDPELEKEYALLTAERSALYSVESAYANMPYNLDSTIEALEENVADAEKALEDAKVEVTNAQYKIDQLNSMIESSDFNPYNYQLQLKKLALDNAKEDLQEAQEELEYYDALFKSSVEALSSSAE